MDHAKILIIEDNVDNMSLMRLLIQLKPTLLPAWLVEKIASVPSITLFHFEMNKINGKGPSIWATRLIRPVFRSFPLMSALMVTIFSSCQLAPKPTVRYLINKSVTISWSLLQNRLKTGMRIYTGSKLRYWNNCVPSLNKPLLSTMR